jgi:hypothetical protein
MYKNNSGFRGYLDVSSANQPRQICRFDYLDKVQFWLLSKLTVNRFVVRYYSYTGRCQ